MRPHALAALTALALAASPATAATVVHQYSGVITSIYDGMTGAPIAFPDFRVGDTFDGCFSYDTAEPASAGRAADCQGRVVCASAETAAGGTAASGTRSCACTAF